MAISLIDQLQDFGDFIWRAQLLALRDEEPKLEPLHLAFMRRAWRNGRVSYERMLHDTRLNKTAISRGGLFLEEHHLAKVTPDPEDKRYRQLRLTQKGYERFIRVESKLAGIVVGSIGVSDLRSLRLGEFTHLLWKLNGYKDPSRVTNRETYRYASTDPNKMIDPSNVASIPKVVLWLEPAEYLDRRIES
jgi:DNA-binding MarR family transcriptional regulator